MLFSKVVVLAPFACVIYCQNIDSLGTQLPDCSLSCLKTAYENAGCAQKDHACACNKIPGTAIWTEAVDCILSACSPADNLKYTTLALQICASASLRVPGFSSSDTVSVSETAPGATASTYSSKQSPTLATSTTTAAGSPTDHLIPSTASLSSALTPSSLPASFDNPKASLSTGAAVGIGVGVTIGAVAVLGAIVFFTLRYRRKSKELKNLRELNAQVGIEERGGDELGKPEIDGKEAKGRAPSGGEACIANEGHMGGERSYAVEFPAGNWKPQGAVELQGAEKGSNSA